MNTIWVIEGKCGAINSPEKGWMPLIHAACYSMIFFTREEARQCLKMDWYTFDRLKAEGLYDRFRIRKYVRTISSRPDKRPSKVCEETLAR